MGVISREAAIDELKQEAEIIRNDWSNRYAEQVKGILTAVNIIEDLPSAQLKTGHWVYDYTSADGHRTYHCSECGCYLQPKHSEPLRSFKKKQNVSQLGVITTRWRFNLG